MRKGPVSGLRHHHCRGPVWIPAEILQGLVIGAKIAVFSRTEHFRGFTGIPGEGGRKEQTDLDIVWLPTDPCRTVGRTVNFCLDSEGSGLRTGLGWTRNARHTVGLYIGKLLFPGVFPF